MKEFLRIVKFTLISISAGIVQIGLFALFNEAFKWNYWVAYLSSLLASVLWNFTINRKVTFKSASNVKVAMLLVLLFYAVFTPVSTILGQMAEENGVNEYIVLVATMLSNFVLEFLYTRYFVYGKSCDTAQKKSPRKGSTKPYRFYKKIVCLFYKKRTFLQTENIPNEPSIIVGNHAQMHGPLTSELYFPYPKKIWCVGKMMNIKEVPAYAYEDFWSYKPKYIRWFYKLSSYLIAPVCSYIFNRADTIGVYRDARGFSTFRNTVNALKEGNHIIITPETKGAHNDFVNQFEDKFVDVAALYYKKEKKILSFVPMYNAGSIKTVIFGKPISYDPAMPMEEQRVRICAYLQDQISVIAKELPAHKIIPYENISKKHYKISK